MVYSFCYCSNVALNYKINGLRKQYKTGFLLKEFLYKDNWCESITEVGK